MKATTNDIRLTFSDTDKPYIYLPLNMSRREAVMAIDPLMQAVCKGKVLSVEVKEHKNRRSLDANNYCWVLCQKIAEVIGNTKEAVYRKVIRDVGQFEMLPIKNEALDTFMARWSGGGIGWFAEVEGPSTIDNYSRVIAYYGSSVYDSREMAILINELVEQAQELDIETRPAAEINALLEAWDAAKS
jgi:hypothetical protein